MRSLGKSLFSKFQKIDPEVQGGFGVLFCFLAFACLFIFFERQQPLLFFLMAFVNIHGGKVLVEGTGRPL